MQQITVTGGQTDCFTLASQYYSDATQFWRIMNANKMPDPFFEGVVTLSIPDPDSSVSASGGIPIT